MRAGRLRHRAQILQDTQASDGRGGWTDTESEFKEIRCEFMPVGSEDTMANGALLADSEFRVRARYHTGITTKMRLKKVDDDRVFHITGTLDPDERRRELYIYCKERKTADA